MSHSSCFENRVVSFLFPEKDEPQVACILFLNFEQSWYWLVSKRTVLPSHEACTHGSSVGPTMYLTKRPLTLQKQCTLVIVRSWESTQDIFVSAFMFGEIGNPYSNGRKKLERSHSLSAYLRRGTAQLLRSHLSRSLSRANRVLHQRCWTCDFLQFQIFKWLSRLLFILLHHTLRLYCYKIVLLDSNVFLPLHCLHVPSGSVRVWRLISV